MTKHVLFYISSHGFGHFGQLSPVINALVASDADIRITLVTGVAESLIQSRLRVPYTLENRATDFGMRMYSAFKVDAEKSFHDYVEFHRNWGDRVENEKRFLKAQRTDLVIGNVPYLPLAAARELNIPSINVCSLNWADIALPYFKLLEGASEIIDTMVDCYNSSVWTLCPQPSMSMPRLRNVRSIGPIAAVGTDKRKQLRERLGIDDSCNLVAIVPGGIATQIPLNTWPRRADFHYIVTWDEEGLREDFSLQKQLSMSFTDIIRSCDAVLTKPGYGMVAETACNGVPVLYAPRGDWPEEPFLVEWWKQNARVVEISHEQFMTGQFQKEFIELQYKNNVVSPLPSGIDEAVKIIRQLLK